MHFDPDKKTISALLGAKKQYEIPRFQREYSWEKFQLNEFFDDIIKNITLEDKKLVVSEYFWGTMLFVGSYIDPFKRKMEVVDGQQRLTTMTIFLSVLSKLLQQLEQPDLAQKVWEYVITKDDNNEPFAVLLNETPNPYFQFLIQKLSGQEMNASTEEEIRIKEAFDFFINNLKFANLKKRFLKLNNSDINGISHVDVLKTLRDQLLNGIVICLCTTDKSQANMIFEILNAKGLTLDTIDLIKNKIFSVMTTEVPADEAKINWKKIKASLSSRNELIDLSTFYRHYWYSRYSKTPEHKLYDAFLKHIKPMNEESYGNFLSELATASDDYLKIVMPQANDYLNKSEFSYIVEVYNNLNNVFNIIQSRIVLLSLSDAYFKRHIISCAMLKKALQAIERFHFAFNAILAQRTSSLEKIYSNFSIGLRKCTSKDASHKLIDGLLRDLDSKILSYDSFKKKFVTLEYSTKTNSPSNLKTKYAIYAIAKHFAQMDVIPNDASIEHIANENSAVSSKLNIGNLLILEKSINESIPANANFRDKKTFYQKSRYPFVADFNNQNHAKWDNEEILNRAEILAKLYYEKILGKPIT